MTKQIIEVSKPFENNFTLTQKFGVYFFMNGRRLKHQGVDWALPGGTSVVACFAGEVVRVEGFRLEGYGRSIYLRSSDGKFEALYAHLEGIHVTKGQKVKSGEKIGLSGRTGFCRGLTGYHLHFGLKMYNEYQDPLKYINEEMPKELLIKPDEYIVKPGDSLSVIASKFYIGADMWPVIYKENEKKIGSDPDVIRPGQILKIPKANEVTNF